MTNETEHRTGVDEFDDASSSGESFTLSSGEATAASPSDKAEGVAEQKTNITPAKSGAAYVPPTNAVDPVVKQPYRWSDCTVTISIQILPEHEGEPRKGYVGIRTHLDAPLIRAVTAADLHPLPPCVEDLIARMKEELPVRAELYLERERRAAEKNKPSTKSAPKRAQLKPGRHTAASLFARVGADERSPAGQESPDATASDDIFGDLSPGDAADEAVANEAHGDAARKVLPTPANVKNTRAARRRPNRRTEPQPPARTNQGSLLG